MKRLNYATLSEQNYSGYLLQDAPEKILQFGEGNFLRGFVDDFSIFSMKRGFFTESALWYSRWPKGWEV